MKIVIFCGGHGTRLWPVSRQSFPKPFVPLLNGKSFFQITYARYRKVYSPEDIFVSTEDKYLPFVRKQATEIPRKNIILEPERRDTLAAYGLATAVVHKYYPDEPVLMSWAKHLIARESVFLNAVGVAGEYSQESGMIVSVDAKPSFASVHNGWVKKGEVLKVVNGFKVVEQERHVEKPAEPLAEKLFAEKNWLIHTGYKVCDTTKLLGYFEKFQPAMHNGLIKIAQAWGTKEQKAVLEREYRNFEKTSIDYGLLEKLPRNAVATIEADMGWEDVGISWETFYKSLATSKQTTVVEGGVDTEFLEAENNLIIGQKGKMIMVIGVSDVAVIDTPDGLLVCRLDKTQKVKDVYEKLERYNKEYTE
ncbi:hypothetical protein A2125_01395 [Candidatus Woesebacteria bacterium GWB1_43_5]|uniref:Nucleotidyl transferase domain-containing protein n=1 Tax=Candidatus Woesebacteria bacterium GWB1_43_5 TaxID=1802474 RepID=A0A1F7WSS8_9BACT|nr:MAG: hypothetical protein A2125_01395 [Candidatus Woesebacteria bacterium GWB1_43_5]